MLLASPAFRYRVPLFVSWDDETRLEVFIEDPFSHPRCIVYPWEPSEEEDEDQDEDEEEEDIDLPKPHVGESMEFLSRIPLSSSLLSDEQE